MFAALLLACCLVHVSLCQMDPPLHGQGLDPGSAGLATGSVPVFVSAELVKLLQIDEQKYTFTAELLIYQVWDDPRANATFHVINAVAGQARTAHAVALGACNDQLDRATRNNSTDSALANCSGVLSVGVPGVPCQKYCTMYASGVNDRFRCCDSVWLPDIQLRNIVATPKDRIALDVVASPGGNRVSRISQVLGTFTAPLDFGHYPFDSQRLSVYMNENPYTGPTDPNKGFHIVPSATFRRVNLMYKECSNRTGVISGSMKDEMARWHINDFVFSCASIPDIVNSTDLLTQQPDPNDPVYRAYGAVDPTNQLASTCGLTIDVSRMSNTAVVSSIVPVAFCVLLSFTAYFMDPSNLNPRIGTCIRLFLALTAVQFVFVRLLPVTSTCSSLVIFILLSYCVIVVTVIESVLVYYIATEHENAAKEGEYNILNFFSTKKKQATAIRQETSNKNEESGQVSTKNVDRPLVEQPLAFFEDNFNDRHFAYRFARRFDLLAGITLIVLYAILSICNFTVGLY